MNLYLIQQYNLIKRIYKESSFLDVLINISDFFDIMNVYAFPNWLDAEIVDMKIRKYFTTIIIKTLEKDMPHPLGAAILTKYGCIVDYKKSIETVPIEIKSEKDVMFNAKTGNYQAKTKKQKVWLVEIQIPNKLIINDDKFDIEAIQKKIDYDAKEETSSIVNTKG